jgi:2-desacetyl-2-hydroxyethyl bacteriochlorophyllide A dehydrogenase
MKAIVYDKKSSTEKLVLREVEKPVPNDDEVLVKIVASSVNAADYRSMKMGIIPKKRIFGADIAGRVELTGKMAGQFQPGNEVAGDLADCGFGGFAEYAVAPARTLAIKPPHLSFEKAAALPLASVTALQGLRMGKIQNGQQVLIVGSGGGVGTFAVQLAKYFGAEVTAVCSTQNAEQTAALGADVVIDYKKEDFTKIKKHFDLILAVNGDYFISTYRKMLKPGGKYVMVGGTLFQILTSLILGKIFSFGKKKMYSLAAKPNRNDLEFVLKLAEQDIIQPVIDRRYSLERTAEAMSYLGKGHARGKVIIIVENEL